MAMCKQEEGLTSTCGAWWHDESVLLAILRVLPNALVFTILLSFTSQNTLNIYFRNPIIKVPYYLNEV